MALALSNLDKVKLAQGEALKICKDDLGRQLEELRATNKSLATWAEKTPIGNETQDKINKLLDGIDALMNLSRVMCGSIGDYVYNQQQINRNGRK